MRRNKKNTTTAEFHGKITGRWTDEEHQRFEEGKYFLQSINSSSAIRSNLAVEADISSIPVLQSSLLQSMKLTLFFHTIIAIYLFGKNWKKVTQHVGTRISAQVRSHAQKVLKDYSPEPCSVQCDRSLSSVTEVKKAPCQDSMLKAQNDNEGTLAKNVVTPAQAITDSLMENIPVTHVDCSEFSHPVVKNTND